MNIQTPSMFYVTPRMFLAGEPRRCIYEQVRVYVENCGVLIGSVGWPTQYLSVENLYLTDSEVGQFFGGN